MSGHNLGAFFIKIELWVKPLSGAGSAAWEDHFLI